MHIINITVRNKIAVNPAQDRYVCGNSDFVVHFDFDSEWDALEVKTARFIKEDGSYVDQLFSGNDCPVPVLSDTYKLHVGVFAGNLSTTTAAYVPCKKSILCGGGVPAAPAEDVYNQIMELLNKGGGGNSLPETAEPLKQLVTDKDGNVAWEDRLAYKYSTTEKGYINVVQEAELVDMEGQYGLTIPLASSPVAGETYAIYWGGNEYASKCVDVSATTDGIEAYAFGNTAVMGDELPIENPAPDATFFLLLMPGGSDGIYGMAVFQDTVNSPVLTIRSVEEVETTTTDIKKVDRELLDVPTPDMDALEGEEGYIANRPCWVYEIPGGWIVWDGVTKGKETLSITLNGVAQVLGYKVCPVPMNKYSFDKGGAYFPTFVHNDAGESSASWVLSKLEMFVTPGLYGLYAKGDTSGAPKYFSYDKAAASNFIGEINGSSGIYIAADWAAQYPYIQFAVDAIYKPLDVEVLPPPDNLNGVYYYRWSQTARSWTPVTIDQLKADLGLT